MAKRETLSWKHNGRKLRKQYHKWDAVNPEDKRNTPFMDVDMDAWADYMQYDNCDDGCPEE